jgi:hypothetical protein
MKYTAVLVLKASLGLLRGLERGIAVTASKNSSIGMIKENRKPLIFRAL